MQTKRPTPTLRMRRLAAELLRLRREAGLSQEEVAARTDINVATLYRIESAKAKPQLRTLNTLLDTYEVEAGRRADLVALQKEAGKRGWLHAYDSELPGQLTAFIGFEQEAREILNYESLFVPGMLQTEDYARAVIAGVLPGATGGEVETRVAARMRRQDLLTTPDRPKLWAVIDEAALHRLVGGPSVRRAQLAHLRDCADSPHVTVQVVPFSAGAHPGMPGSFIILRFGPQDPDVVYIDSMAGDLFLEEETDLIRHNMMFEHLRAVALSPSDTLALLASLINEDHE
ncbi:helix-turn-helix transcriptional regulator [Nonomuraea longicatena]|uniref:helix-turn-helix domain-containing protein n=1 Tax=Nonomuraea longicatena TaxID=83682 RepID=UPI0031E0DF3A